MTYDVQPAHVDMLIDLSKDTKKELILDATAKKHLDITTVSFGADIVQIATEKGKPIVIKTNVVQLKFPAKALAVSDRNNTVKLKVLSNKAPTVGTFNAVSPLMEFSLTEKDKTIESFNIPVEAEFYYDPSKVQDPSKVGVYWLDEATGIWTYIGGTVSVGGTIRVALPHFSKYAVLEKTGETSTGSTPSGSTAGTAAFTDIQGHWAQKEIEQLVNQHIVDGMDAGSFQPNNDMTRGQLVMILNKALSLPASTPAKSFTDVAADSWYKDAVYAAYSANIVGGTSDSTFDPEAIVTREQLAVMMVNAYLYANGKQLSDLQIQSTGNYEDASSISEWATPYVAAASTLGLLNGIDDTHFAPAQNSTRAQVAAVVVRMLNTKK